MNGIAGWRRWSLLFAGLILTSAAAVLPVGNARGQSTVVLPNDGIRLNYGSYFGGATAASLQIQAEAQYLQAYGLAQRDLAVARVVHAEAQRLEQANSMQAVRDYYERKELREAERERQIEKRLKNKEKGNERILARLNKYPELNGTEIITGVALNFLKNRLGATVVTFRSASMGSRDAVDDVSRQLHVTPGIVHSLWVRQSLGRGETFVFRLDEGRPLQVDWWPPVLRSPELNDVRSRFEKARAEVFKLQTSADFEAGIRRLILAHAALQEAFVNAQTRDKRLQSVQAWESYNDAKAFLETLSGEVRRLHKLGPGQTVPQDLAYKGTELPELLAHMVRNGLEFAPAKPGDEPAYNQVFHMLRDLYAAFEADREATK